MRRRTSPKIKTLRGDGQANPAWLRAAERIALRERPRPQGPQHLHRPAPRRRPRHLEADHRHDRSMTMTTYDTSQFPITVPGTSAEYLIQLTENGEPWCSVKATGKACQGWKFSKAEPKTCKHVRLAIQRLAGGATKAEAREASRGFKRALDAENAAAEKADPMPRPNAARIPKPMKLKSTDFDSAAAFIGDDEWVAEQKVDGVRCTVHVPADLALPVVFGSGGGSPLKSSVARQWFDLVESGLPRLDREYTLDGELMWDGDYHTFDVLSFAGVDTKPLRLDERRAILVGLFAKHEFGERVYLLPQAATPEDKATMLATIEQQNGEGVVFKHTASRYVEGDRTDQQLKLKFRKTVDCVVTGRNVGRDDNAVLAVYDEAGGTLTEVGRCSMIGKPDAQVGDVMEVAYLYATDALRLYQPSAVRLRDDKPAAECLLDQLRVVNKAVLKAG